MMDMMERNAARGGEASLPTAYEYPHPAGPVMPLAYRLTCGETEQYLLIRWRVDAEHPADSFRYTLEQMDSGGRILAVTEHTCPRVATSAEAEDFIPTAGIVVHSRCVDIKVTVTEVRSDGYVYRLRGNAYEVDFRGDAPWVYEKKNGGVTPKKSLQVRSKRGIHGRFLWLAPLLAALLLFNVLFLVSLRQYVADVAMLMLEILANLFGLLFGF